jgi:putative ABC transport system permease protein
MKALLAIVNALSVRYYRRFPARFALCVAGLAAGVGVASAINLTNARVIASFEDSLVAVAGKTTLSLEPRQGLAPEELEQLRFVWDKGAFTPYMRLRAAAGERVVTVYGFDFLGAGGLREFSFQRAANADADADADADETTNGATAGPRTDGLITPEDSPLGRAGDTVALVINGRRMSFPIVGELRAIDNRLPPQNAVYADLGRLFALQPRLTGVDFSVPPERLEPLRAELQRLFPGARITTTAERRQATNEMLSAFQMNLAALGVIALLVSAYLVYNTVNISVLQREGMLGVLLAIGAAPRTLFAAIIAEGALIGAAGALVGCGLGWLASAAAYAEVTSTLSSVFRLDAGGAADGGTGALLGSFLIGVFASALAAYFPARRAAAIAGAVARKQGRSEYRPARVGYAWIGAALCIAGAGASWTLAAHLHRPEPGFAAVAFVIGAISFLAPLAVLGAARLLRRPHHGAALLAAAAAREHVLKIAIACAALAVALSMAGAVTIMVSSFRETVRNWLETVVVADVYIKSESGDNVIVGELEADLARRAAALPFVRAVVTIRTSSALYRGQPIELAANNFETAARVQGFSFVEGDRSDVLRAREIGGVLASEVFATRFQVRRGDSIEFEGRRLEICGVYRNYASERGYLLMDDALFRELVGDSGPGGIALYLKPGVESADAILQTRAALADHALSMNASREIRARALEIFDQTFRLTFALQWIAGGIAALSVLTTLAGLAIERRRDLAALLALGARPARIDLAMAIESQLIALSAIALAAPGAACLALLLIKVINKYSFGWTIVAAWPVGPLVAGAALACALALLAAVYPIRLIRRQNPVEALKRE